MDASELLAFAEDPAAYVAVGRNEERISTDRAVVTFEQGDHFWSTTVTRVRFADRDVAAELGNGLRPDAATSGRVHWAGGRRDAHSDRRSRHERVPPWSPPLIGAAAGAPRSDLGRELGELVHRRARPGARVFWGCT